MCGGGSCGRGNVCCEFIPKATRMFCCSPCMVPMCPPPRSCPEMCCEDPCSCPRVCHPCACAPKTEPSPRVRCFAFRSPPRWVSTTVTAPCYTPCCPRPTLLTYTVCPTPCCCPKTMTCVDPPMRCC